MLKTKLTKWLQANFKMTVAEFAAYTGLPGADGATGPAGDDGADGADGAPGADGADSNIKIYRALVDQASSDAPTSTILRNDLGGVPVWTRTGAGIYSLTLEAAFTSDKTFCRTVSPDYGSSCYLAHFKYVDADHCEIRTAIAEASLLDLGGLLYLEIVVEN